jgi:DAHP synthase ferredoxin-like domain
MQAMIVNMSPEATEEQIEHVIQRIKECGFQAHVIRGAERTVIGAVGKNGRRGELEALQAAPDAVELLERLEAELGDVDEVLLDSLPISIYGGG